MWPNDAIKRGQDNMADKKTKRLDLAGEILPVVGTVALLGLWLYQSVGLEQRQDELRKIASARGVYQTYQSHNAMFNAIEQGLEGKAEQVANLRSNQVYNYELGLRALEDVLSPEERQGIEPAPNAFSGTPSYSEKIDATQRRLVELQKRVDAKEKRAQAAADSANAVCLWLYLVLSLISVAGAICKIVVLKREESGSGTSAETARAG
jgi:hypothetical protein